MHHTHSDGKDLSATEIESGNSAGEIVNFEDQPSERDISTDDTFASASDLSSVLHSSQISTSSGDSNSNSASSSYHYSSSNSTDCSSLSVSMSASMHSSSEKREDSIMALEQIETSDDPVFATCTTFSSSSSTTNSASTVKRSESWSALRSASVDSSPTSGGSDKENIDFRSSESSMKEQTESPLETYHTPSTSMHNIQPYKNNSGQGNDENKSKQNLPITVEVIDQKQDLNVLDDLGSTSSRRASKSLTTSFEDDNNITGKTDLVVEEKRDQVPVENAGIDINEIASASSESNASKDGSSIGIGPTPKELTKAAKLARKPAKKRMWYQQIFSASYKSRSGDFKKLFKELPIKERLLVDYSCALQKEILVQGRMYVSQGYLSFHANIFGWETQTSIRLKDITSITKEKTALVIPNAIQVVSEGGEKLFFTSFVTRDSTFMMLFKLWQNSLLEDALPSKEIQKLIHSSYGEELIITSEDEMDDCVRSSQLISDLTDVTNLVTLCDFEGSKSIIIDPKVCSSDGVAPAIIISGSLTSSFLSPKSAGEELLNGRRGLEPSDLSDSSDSDEDFQVAGDGILAKDLDLIDIPPCPVNHAEGKETINAIISCNIDQLFTMLFTNSKFYLDFHTSRKTFNIHQSPWEYGKDGKQTRQVAMTVSLSAVMGPKHSQVTETQIMDIISKPGLFYIIDSESANAGVPYADTFYVTVHYCLSRVSASESKLIIVNQIKYRKSVWGITKSIIEKNAWAGIEEFYCHLEKSLKEECTKMMIGSSPLPSPKHSGSTIPRRRLPRKKGQAPGIPIAITPSARISLRAGSVGADMGTIPAAENVPDLVATDGSLVLKIVLIVLSGLLCLNGFLYFKLNHLETGSSSSLFPAPSFTFTGEIPQNHQDWLVLLQKQQALHQIELQKWHQVLMSALKILHQAESDLEALKFHIGSYAGAKYSVQMATHPSSSEDLQHKSTESKAVDDNDQKSLDKDTSDQ